MKFKFINRFFALVLGVAMIASISSCTDDDLWNEGEEDEFAFSTYGLDWEKKGALVTVGDVVNGFYNFAEGGNASIGFTVDDFGGDATEINVYKSYNGGSPVLHTTVTSVPSALTVTLAEAANGLVELSSVKLLDQFTFTFDINTAEGSFPSGASLTVDVSCVSALEGDYTAATVGTSTDGCCPGPVETSGPIKLTALGGGEYTISDWSGNIYFAWYGPDGGNYGIDEAYVAAGGMNTTIKDVCDQISATFVEPFGTETVLTGSVDPASGVITYSWVNGYGDAATVVLTPM